MKHPIDLVLWLLSQYPMVIDENVIYLFQNIYSSVLMNFLNNLQISLMTTDFHARKPQGYWLEVGILISDPIAQRTNSIN